MYTIEFDPDYEQELEFILTSIVLDYTVAYAEKLQPSSMIQSKHSNISPNYLPFMPTSPCIANS